MRVASILMISMFLLSITLSPGCSSSAAPPGPKAFPAQGKVTSQSRPAVGVKVVLNPFPLEAKPRYLPAGTTDKEGNFRLSSYTTDDGAPAGEYVVTLEWPTAKEANEDDSVDHADRLKGRYSNPSKSTWKITIKDGPNTLGPFDIK